MDNVEITLLGKCYHTIDRLAGRIGIDAGDVCEFDVIETDKVVAVRFKYRNRACSGHAICKQGDVFNFDIGLNIAIARAMRKAAWSDMFKALCKVAEELDQLVRKIEYGS